MHISCSRMECKDDKSLHSVNMQKRTDQKKVRKFTNFMQCIYAEASVLLLLTLVIFKTKS